MCITYYSSLPPIKPHLIPLKYTQLLSLFYHLIRVSPINLFSFLTGMDPRNLHTQSSSYVGLLHSQQGSVFHENFPYESFHSSVNFGESEIPAFSSQQSEDAPVDTPVERLVRRKWTPADDEVLISAWLNSSKDAIVGNEQKSGTFWNRVGDYYAESPHGGEDGEKREHLHCKKRWQRINDQVNKFCAAYSAAERQISSGIIHLYGDEYLRHPTPDDLQRLLYIGEQRGFPRLVESIDCMH